MASARSEGGAPSKSTPIWLDAVVLVAVVALPAFIEIGLAFSPGPLAYVMYGLASVALLRLSSVQRRRLVFDAAALALALTVLCMVPWNPRKEFLRHFDQVRIGMTVEEVSAVMDSYSFADRIRAHGLVARTYIHSRKGRFDSDWGMVSFLKGRVVEVTFLPD
jgi:hypothetical protein